MREKLQAIIEKYAHLAEQMTDPDIYGNQEKLTTIAKEHSAMEDVVSVGKEYISVLDQIADDKDMLEGDDEELKQIAQEELDELETRLITLEENIKVLLLPKDPNDNKNLILEIRAGTGGDEAALFAADLFRIYTRYAERKNWTLKVMDSSDTGIGGIKEAIVSIQGKGAFGMLKYESGVHRVQRVPKTETSGRVHTSAATLAVLPEAEDVDIEVNEADLKIDTYRASGAGGQHVNKTSSAVRLTHMPTGIVVSCQNERSQLKNKNTALKMMKARLYQKEMEALAASQDHLSAQKKEIGWGSQIRSYVFHPYNLVKDHRTKHETSNIQAVMDGDIDNFIRAYLLEKLEK